MKLPHVLEDVLGQRSMVTILRYLAIHDQESSGRGIAAALKMNPWTCHLALRELVDQGVVTRRAIGNSHLFRLNAGNAAVQSLLRPLFDAEAELMDQVLRDLVSGLPDSVISVIVHESLDDERAERGSGETEIMVLVAGSGSWAAAKRILAERSAELTAKFGASLAVTVLPADEFARRYRMGDPLARQVRATGRVILGRDPAMIE